MYKKYFLLTFLIFSARFSITMNDELADKIAILNFLVNMENDNEHKEFQPRLHNIKKLLQKNHKEQWLSLLKDEIKQGAHYSVITKILTNIDQMGIQLRNEINPLEIDEKTHISLLHDAIRKDDEGYLKAVLKHNPIIREDDFQLLFELRKLHIRKDSSGKEKNTYAYLDALCLLQDTQLNNLANIH